MMYYNYYSRPFSKCIIVLVVLFILLLLPPPGSSSLMEENRRIKDRISKIIEHRFNSQLESDDVLSDLFNLKDLIAGSTQNFRYSQLLNQDNQWRFPNNRRNRRKRRDHDDSDSDNEDDWEYGFGGDGSDPGSSDDTSILGKAPEKCNGKSPFNIPKNRAISVTPTCMHAQMANPFLSNLIESLGCDSSSSSNDNSDSSGSSSENNSINDDVSSENNNSSNNNNNHNLLKYVKFLEINDSNIRPPTPNRTKTPVPTTPPPTTQPPQPPAPPDQNNTTNTTTTATNNSTSAATSSITTGGSLNTTGHNIPNITTSSLTTGSSLNTTGHIPNVTLTIITTTGGSSPPTTGTGSSTGVSTSTVTTGSTTGGDKPNFQICPVVTPPRDIASSSSSPSIDEEDLVVNLTNKEDKKPKPPPTFDPSRPTTFPLPSYFGKDRDWDKNGFRKIRIVANYTYFDLNKTSTRQCKNEFSKITFGNPPTNTTWCKRKYEDCIYNCTKYDVLNRTLEAYLKKLVIPTSIDIIQQMLWIPTRNTSLRLNRVIWEKVNRVCSDGQNNIYIDESLISNGIPNADLVIYFTSRPMQHIDVIAFGTPCNFDYDDSYGRRIFGRPLAGYINLSPSWFYGTYHPTINLYGFQRAVQSTVHELIHVLGFSPNLYSSYIDLNGKPHDTPIIQDVLSGRGIHPVNVTKKITMLATPRVVETARKYYNCPTLKGVELESDCTNSTNEDPVCAHWESRIAYSEMMTSESSPTMALSVLTLSLLQDTGWYLVDTKFSQEFRWGQNEGCNFLTGRCESWSTATKNKGYFCDTLKPREYKCTPDARAIGVCNLDNYNYSFSDTCKYYQHYPNPNYGGPKYTDYCAFIEFDASFQNKLRTTLCTDFGQDQRCFGTARSNKLNSSSSQCFNTRCFNDLLYFQTSTNSCYTACPKDGGEVWTRDKNNTYVKVTCPPSHIVCLNYKLDVVFPRGNLKTKDDPYWKSKKFLIPIAVAGVLLLSGSALGVFLYKKIFAKKIHSKSDIPLKCMETSSTSSTGSDNTSSV